MTQEVKCDLCGEMTKAKFEVRYHPRGLQETYFRCRKCNEVYTCYVTDPKVRKVHKEIRGGNLTDDEVGKKQKEVSDIMMTLKDSITKGGA